MSEELNLYGLVNKPPIDEIFNLDLVNKPPLVMEDDELAHYGILGMHWGIRRYQNPDGSLTPAGKRRVAKLRDKQERKEKKAAAKRAKMIANPNERYLNKNLEKFTNEEIINAIKRLNWKKDIEDIKKERVKIGKEKADKIIGYGDTLNNALKFLNSDIGRGIREKLGLGSDKVFNFYEREKRAKELEDEKRNFAYEVKRDTLRKERDLNFEIQKNAAQKQRDLEWEIKRNDEFIKRHWINQNDIREKYRNSGGGGGGKGKGKGKGKRRH